MFQHIGCSTIDHRILMLQRYVSYTQYFVSKNKYWFMIFFWFFFCELHTLNTHVLFLQTQCNKIDDSGEFCQYTLPLHVWLCRCIIFHHLQTHHLNHRSFTVNLPSIDVMERVLSICTLNRTRWYFSIRCFRPYKICTACTVHQNLIQGFPMFYTTVRNVTHSMWRNDFTW